MKFKTGPVPIHGPIGASTALYKNTLDAFDRLEWTMLVIGSILCGFACVGTAALLGIPREPHFNGSLVLGGMPAAGIVAAVIAILISLVVGTLTASFVEREAALFCCCLGVAALGVRCGPIRPVLQYAGSASVFISLAVEVAVLAVILMGGWFGLRWVLDRAGLKRDAGASLVAPNEIADAALQQKLLTLGMQMLAMGIMELIFVQSDAKAQAMAGVFVAAYLGSLAAYMFTPLPDGIWYWAGPMAVALIGYLLAYFSPDGFASGDMHGWSAALARPTPLDYAGMGTAGALLGYWSMRRWMQGDEAGEDETAAA